MRVVEETTGGYFQPEFEKDPGVPGDIHLHGPELPSISGEVPLLMSANLDLWYW